MFTEKLARERETKPSDIEEGLMLLNTDFLVQESGADLREGETGRTGNRMFYRNPGISVAFFNPKPNITCRVTHMPFVKTGEWDFGDMTY